MNRIQRKDNTIRTYVINKISLSCFDKKVYIQNNGYDGLIESEEYIYIYTKIYKYIQIHTYSE